MELDLRFRYRCIKDCWLNIKDSTLLYVYEEEDTRQKQREKKYVIKDGIIVRINKGQYIEVDDTVDCLTYTSVDDSPIDAKSSVLIFFNCLQR